MEPTNLHFTNSLGRRYCVIRYIKASQMLHLIWRGTATKESIQEVRSGVLQLLQSYPCPYILNDTQDFFQGPTSTLYHLTESDWDAKVGQLGVRYIAHVLHPDAEIPDTHHSNGSVPEVKFFLNLLDAMEWIKTRGSSLA
jgi:hypothetical protein